jgi:hypothetical protein
MKLRLKVATANKVIARRLRLDAGCHGNPLLRRVAGRCLAAGEKKQTEQKEKYPVNTAVVVVSPAFHFTFASPLRAAYTRSPNMIELELYAAGGPDLNKIFAQDHEFESHPTFGLSCGIIRRSFLSSWRSQRSLAGNFATLLSSSV